MKKVCTKCKNEKELTEFRRDKTKKDGYYSSCKECAKAYEKANKEKRSKAGKDYYKANKEKRIEYNKAYKKANEKKIKEYNKAYKEAHKANIKKYNKDYREANKEKLKEYNDAYKERNKEKLKIYRESRKEYFKAYLKEYRKTEAGKEANRKKCSKRRAKKKQVDNLGTYTITEWQECLKFFNYCDAYTGEPLNNDISVDHITPISKGGTNNINNLAPCKKAVNSSKQANLIDEWYPKQPFYSKKRHNKIKEWIRIKSQINLFEL